MTASPPDNVMPFISGRFYMNPAFGRSIERSRAADANRPEPRAQDQDRWVTLAGRHVLIQTSEHGPSTTRRDHAQHSAATHPKPLKSTTLPSSGVASIYSDAFDRKRLQTGKYLIRTGTRQLFSRVLDGTQCGLARGSSLHTGIIASSSRSTTAARVTRTRPLHGLWTHHARRHLHSQERALAMTTMPKKLG